MSHYSRRRGYSRHDSGYSYYGFAPYVPVATRRAKALAAAKKASKGGRPFSPVEIKGRAIATTFWGKAWCQHLESHSDYENRLPRGRTYVRNGSVIDLQIARGKITARVSGSEIYTATITIKPLAPKRWEAIKKKCAGRVDSLIDLLKGRLAEGVMRVIIDRDHGLFPAPGEIEKDCSCPDSAGLCKHLAAVLYGVGARLDTQPELLFVLRGVDQRELIATATTGATQLAPASAPDAGAAIAENQLAEVFGIDIAPAAEPVAPAPAQKPAAETAAKPARKKQTVRKQNARKQKTRARKQTVPRKTAGTKTARKSKPPPAR